MAGAVLVCVSAYVVQLTGSQCSKANGQRLTKSRLAGFRLCPNDPCMSATSPTGAHDEPHDILPRPQTPDGHWLESAELYEELRRIARSHMSRQRPHHTLTATALVHEVYLKLHKKEGFNDHLHTLSAAARAMRSILMDHARKHASLKRSSVRNRQLDVEDLLDSSAPFWVQLEFNDLMEKLEREDPDLYLSMELRYYGGLSEYEVATATSTPLRTAQRKLKLGRLWLAEALREE